MTHTNLMSNSRAHNLVRLRARAEVKRGGHVRVTEGVRERESERRKAKLSRSDQTWGIFEDTNTLVIYYQTRTVFIHTSTII